VLQNKCEDKILKISEYQK